jgi:hypothetical protein
LAYATFGYWPWRGGATWAARSVLVNPADLLTAAGRICTEVRAGAAWATNSAAHAHQDRAVVELRLDELLKDDEQQVSGRDAVERIVVRSPNLLEVTTVFPRRSEERIVRGQWRSSALPGAAMHANRQAYYKQAAIGRWRPFAHSLCAPGAGACVEARRTQRPPVAVIVEDAYALNIASRLLRARNAALVPRRAPPAEIGAYLPRRGALGLTIELPTDLATASFEPDIKDAALAPIRKRLVALGTGLREEAAASAADAASRALRFLRRAASLPIGLSEARGIADILHTEDDEVDRAERSAFRAKMELAPLRCRGPRSRTRSRGQTPCCGD